MKRTVYWIVGLMLLSTVMLPALTVRADEKITKEDIENRRQEIVVASMKFKDKDKKQAFLEVYVPYQERLMHLLHSQADLIAQYVNDEAAGKLTMEEASQLLTKSEKLVRERVAIQEAYANKLKKVLSPDKVIRAYQIENRLFAIWSVAVAEIIPLAK